MAQLESSPPPPAERRKIDDRLIVALDVPNAAAAQELVRKIGDSAHFYKVGLQLFTAEGPDIVRDLLGSGKRVFLDLKLHDIPNTVAGAVKSLCELQVDMLTVHASGGSAMLRAASEAAASAARPPKILAVTVLTSLGADELAEVGWDRAPQEQVLRLAKLAQAARCDGVVCSPHEIAAVRKAIGAEMAVVVPGVRPVGSEKGDQARVATPEEAIRAGASHLVIGRPITAATDPTEAARAILLEMSLND
jgi:orotidine-5'-phosphate decarboxylase